MKRTLPAAVAMAAALSLTVTACGGSSTPSGSEPSASLDTTTPVTLTLSGWSLSTTPEFQVLADAYTADHPNVTIELKEYDSTNYDTQMIADLAAGSAPDLYTLKNLKNFYTYQDGGQLVDVSDIAASVAADVPSVENYAVDGKTYAIPYRQDSWFLYYNRDLFDQAGIAYPDGTWTWDDYADAAEQLTAKFKDAGLTDVTGTYQHNWQSVVQSFALAQSEGVDAYGTDLDYMKPFYERSLNLQDTGAQPSYGTVTTNKLTYQAQFGTQKSAMMLMGSWYVATLITQQANGDANEFEWGIAPAPQVDSSTVDNPVTFGNPTAIGINPSIDEAKLATAKDFLAFIASDEAAQEVAKIGITPARSSDAVTDAYFSVEGAPTDDLSKTTFSTHDTKAEWPADPRSAALLNVLNDAHTAIMSESQSLDDALAQASSRIASEIG